MLFLARVISPHSAPSIPHLVLHRLALPTLLVFSLVAGGCGSNTTTPSADTAVGADSTQDGTTLGDGAGSSDAQVDNDLSAGTDTATGTDATAGCNKLLFAEVEALMVAECGGCHDKPNGVFKATSCSSTAAKKSKIKSEVKSNSMPPGGGLTAAEKAQIIKWVDDGGLCTVCP